MDNAGVAKDKLYSTRLGNVQGVYKPGHVNLQPELLDSFKKNLGPKIDYEKPFLFVFHGCAGSEKKDIENAVSFGVVNMNVDTDTEGG